MNDRPFPFPGFADFCKLLRIQLNIKNNPITSVRSGPSSQSSSNYPPRSQNVSQSIHGSRSYQQQGHSSHRTYSHAASLQNSSQSSISCFYCKQSHLMTHCQGFLSLSPADRRAFCQSEMLCFGCLRHGHSSRECQRRLSCATCGRQHPTVLHDDNYLSRQRGFQPPQSNSFQRNAATSNYNNRPPQSYFEASMHASPQRGGFTCLTTRLSSALEFSSQKNDPNPTQ